MPRRRTESFGTLRRSMLVKSVVPQVTRTDITEIHDFVPASCFVWQDSSRYSDSVDPRERIMWSPAVSRGVCEAQLQMLEL